MPCQVFTPPLFWLAGMFVSCHPSIFICHANISANLKERIWTRLLGATSMTLWPCWLSLLCCMTCIASDRPSLPMSVGCVCWLALQKLQVFLCHHASPSQHALGLGFTAERSLTLTSLQACTQTHISHHCVHILLRLRTSFFTADISKFAPWSPHICALNAQQMYCFCTHKPAEHTWFGADQKWEHVANSPI